MGGGAGWAHGLGDELGLAPRAQRKPLTLRQVAPSLHMWGRSPWA